MMACTLPSPRGVIEAVSHDTGPLQLEVSFPQVYFQLPVHKVGSVDRTFNATLYVHGSYKRALCARAITRELHK